MGRSFARFADVLLAPGSSLLGATTPTCSPQFVSWREFGFASCERATWRYGIRHVYGGAPYCRGSRRRSSIGNALLLFLPLAAAINWTIAINVWLLGVGMHLWARQRGLLRSLLRRRRARDVLGGRISPMSTPATR